jgi:23S rRNA (uridine2552-2'-O)-methyltransferase
MTRWYSEKNREHYYKQAKKDGYRARSSYKLKQIQKKFNIIHGGDVVVDLGAAPGGWSQVAQELAGDRGGVIGVDIAPVEPIDGVTFLQADVTAQSIIKQIKRFINNDEADVVISDMSPDISGSYTVDQARSIYLCEHAFKIARVFLKPGGNFVCKAFMGQDLDVFIKKLQTKFGRVKCFSPSASRKRSSEIYLIAQSFRKNLRGNME